MEIPTEWENTSHVEADVRDKTKVLSCIDSLNGGGVGKLFIAKDSYSGLIAKRRALGYEVEPVNRIES
jgi:hypothetical protein